MSAFLNLLKGSLVVEVVTRDSSSSDLPLVTSFIVKNVATKSESEPEIFFDEVVLTVGVPPNMHVEKRMNLASGESFTYDHHSRYSDLGKIVYSIDGKVSPSHLLRVRTTVTNIPAKVASISIPSYVQVLKDLNIHKWLTEIIEGMLLPETGINEAEIKALQDKFRNAVKEISNTRSQLEQIYGFIVRRNDSDRQNVTNHRTLIDKYLTHTDQACSELRKMLETHNAKTIDATRNQLVAGLRQELHKIDESSQSLVK